MNAVTFDQTETLFETESLKILVARDGIEPPTPAFSEPLTVLQKWFVSMGFPSALRTYDLSELGRLRMI